MSETLREIFYNHEGNLIHKWDHYFDIYEKYFLKYKGKELNILEIGISHGGSIQLWKKYFGEKVNIYAVDINPECAKFEDKNVTIFIGSQDDEKFLKTVGEKIPSMDIILDDGGHTMNQQILTFNLLYSKVKEGGIYMVEDTHTSYWYEFHGGFRKPTSFIEYSKNLIDSLYEHHITGDKKRIKINDNTTSINSISFYDSIVVFEKLQRKTPFHIQKGNETITPYNQIELKKKSLIKSVLSKKQENPFFKNYKGKI